MNTPVPPTAAAPADDPRPVEPEMLPEGACCGSGCDPCVLDFYRSEQLAWQRALRAWEERQAQREAAARASSAGTGPGA